MGAPTALTGGAGLKQNPVPFEKWKLRATRYPGCEARNVLPIKDNAPSKPEPQPRVLPKCSQHSTRGSWPAAASA